MVPWLKVNPLEPIKPTVVYSCYTSGVAVMTAPTRKAPRIVTPPQTVTLREAAARLDVHENTVRNWFDRGYLKGARTPGGRRRIFLADLERLEHMMFDVPTSLVEGGPTTPAPQQLENPVEYLPTHLS